VLCVVCGVWCVVCGVLCAVCCVRCVECGVRSVMCNAWAAEEIHIHLRANCISFELNYRAESQTNEVFWLTWQKSITVLLTQTS